MFYIFCNTKITHKLILVRLIIKIFFRKRISDSQLFEIKFVFKNLIS